MSISEELLIQIRSIYESGGFDEMYGDMERIGAQQDAIAAASTSTGIKMDDALASNIQNVSQAQDAINNYDHEVVQLGEQITGGLSPAMMGLNTSKFEELGMQLESANREVAGSPGLWENLSASASSAWGTIKEGSSGVIDDISTINNGLMGLVSAYGALTIASNAWSGAVAAQSNQVLLSRKYGAQSVPLQQQIQNTVASLPADDTYTNQLMTQMVYRGGAVNQSTMQQWGTSIADYLSGQTTAGHNQAVTQRDLQNYILTGNTLDMQRASILRDQLDTLKGQPTVAARMQALQKALNADGWAGMSTMDTTANKQMILVGELQKAATILGSQILPPATALIDAFLQLDSDTHGFSTELGMAGAFLFLVMGSIGMMVGPLKAGWDIFMLLPKGIMSAADALGLYSAAEGEAAATGLLMDAPLLPILLVIAAVVALVVIIYELGKAWGWWNNLGDMGNVILANLTNAWNIFIGALGNAGGAIVGVGQFIYNLPGMAENAMLNFIGAVVAGLWALPGEIQGALWASLLFVAYWVPFMIGYSIRLGADFVTNVGIFLWKLPGNIYMILVQTGGRIQAGAILWYNNAVNGGRNVLNGFVLFIRQTPGRVWGFLVNTSGRIVTFGQIAYTDAVNAGLNVYNGLHQDIANAPQMVEDELNRIGQAIMNAGGILYNDAVQLGQNMYNGLKAGLGINSPGLMYHALNDELGRMSGVMSTSNITLKGVSADLGNSIVAGFNPTISKTALINSTPIGGGNTTTIAPVFNIGSIDSEERKNSVIQEITEHLSDLNDKSGG